jgi:DNA polymerase-3 subunit gamma/tau
MTDSSLFDLQAFDAPAAPAATHSLYRKYRPTSFASEEFVGQEHVVNTLRNAIALDRISHAYLFCGPRGTGKTTTARLLAKAVNCLDQDPHNRPCNACDACRAINQGASIDVIEIDAASNRGIDDIRDLRERVKYAPTQLKTKFYIIDEAHQITGAAANAFLKTLEEPPAHTRFVLATTDPEELLSTIVSRCQRFDFRRIGLDAMLPALRRIADLEGIAIDDDALPVIARQATGSMRDALGMLDQAAMYRDEETTGDQPITAQTVRTVLGVSRNERVESLARALAERDPAGGLREVNAAVEAGDDIRQLGRQLVTYLRLLLLERAGGTSDADETARDLAGRFSLQELAALIAPMAELDARTKRSSIPQLPLELAIVEGANRGQVTSAPVTSGPVAPTYREPAPRDAEPLAPAAPRTSLKDRVRGAPAPRARVEPDVERRPEPAAPTVEQRAPASAPPATGGSTSIAVDGANGISVDRLAELWPQIRADVKALNRRIEALLQQVDPAGVSGNQVLLVSPYDFHRNRVNTDEVRQVIEGVIGRLTGVNVQVSCVSREEADQIRTSAAASPGTGSPSPARIAHPTPPSVATMEGDPQEPVSTGAASPDSPGLTGDEVEDRIKAARNIFDAVPIDD